MGATASVALGGLLAGSIYSAEDQKRKANDLQKKQEKQAKALEEERITQDQISKATDQRDVARKRQRMLSVGGNGMRDTILAGSTGTGLGQDVTRKTLLGQ